MTRLYLALAALVFSLALIQAPADTKPTAQLTLNPGDRIWVLGDTFAERDSHFGYFEALLQARFPEHKLTLRNLAWSGDTPSYQPRPFAFQDMYRAVTQQPADVVFLCFGMSASFEGEDGLARFEDGLLQQVRTHRREGKARVVVVAPIAHEQLGPDLPDPKAHNEDLKKYAAAARAIADAEKVHFVDLFTPTLALMSEAGGAPLTINGIHLSQYGYWVVAQFMAEQLGLMPRYEPIVHNAKVKSDGLDLESLRAHLPTPPPAGVKVHPSILKKQPVLKITNLGPGKHTIKMDDKAYLVADEKELAAGVPLLRSPAHDAGEDLRLTIAHRNQQFFLRWRAVNGEYIYGRRKEPFGVKNFPDEMKQRDRIIAAADRKIHEIARPLKKLDGAFEPGANALYLVKRLLPDIPPATEVYNQKQGIIGGREFATAADPNEALKTFKVADGYEISVWASEKDFPLEGPVAMAFDTKGRLWVATMPSYPHDIPGVPPNDKLLILEDTKGAGKADKVTTFADRLYLPTGFEFSHDGVLVAQQPNLMLLRDTDGDDKADTREIVLHGFGTGDSHHSMHAFQWGPDGGLYFAEGTFHRSMVESAHGVTRLFDAGLFRYEPQRHKMEAFVSYPFANPWGHIFDRWGQNFIADASGGANYFGLPLTGYTEHPRQHPPMKTFTATVRPTCGCEIVSSRHFPDDIQGDFLVNNCIGFQGIKRHKIIEEGSGFTSKELPPLLFSTDPSFRPVAITFGPDGLYIADWYNPLVGHMQHSIRDAGRDHIHGRIYRITAKNRPLLKSPKIHNETLPKFLDLLKSPEDRTRYWVRQEIRTRDKEQVEKAVWDWAKKLDQKDSDHERYLLEVLWALQTKSIVSTDLIDTLLGSPEPRARAAAVRAVRFWPGPRERVLNVLWTAVEDVHPRVRLEAVVALSFFKEAKAAEVALLALKRPMDYYLDYALKETMTALEPYWRPAVTSGKEFAAGNPAGQKYIIYSVGAAELVKMASSADVYHALLSRDHVPLSVRRDAIAGLAKLNKTDTLTEIFAAILRMDASDNPAAAHVLHDLTRLLADQPAQEVAKVRAKLEGLLQQARRPITRQAAYTTLMTADGSVERTYELAVQSIPALADWLGAISILPEAKLRASAWPKVQPLLDALPPNLAAGVKATKPPVGRYVRIELPGTTRTLTLAEVEVFSKGSNIARSGKATQSTTAHGGEATRGIDGNKSGRYADGGQTHTAENVRFPWWEVDLGREQPIEAIEVWNRSENNGAFASRLDKFRLILLDDQRKEVWKKEDNPGPPQSVRFDLGLNPAATVRRAAMNAATRLDGHEGEVFTTLASFVKAGDLRDDAIRALRNLPRSKWPTAQVKPLVQSIVSFVSKVPAQQRTAPEVRDALQLASDLTTVLPVNEARELRAQLGDVGVTVVQIRTQPHKMVYDRAKFHVEAGKPVVLVFENNDIMPHNLIVAKPGALAEVGMAADRMSQDPDAYKLNFVPKSDKVLHATKLLQPRESQRLEFLAPKTPGEYVYVCTFPGHWRLMHGTMHVVAKLADVPPSELEPRLLPTDLAVRPFVRAWTFEELLPELMHIDRGRSFERGKLLFKETTCLQCHKMGTEGGSVGPNLCDVPTRLATRKWTRADLLREVVEPSKVIEDKFATWNIETLSGALISGVIVAEDKKKVTVAVNPLTKPVEVKVDDIELRTKAKISMMPVGLLNTLDRDEVLDLLAYVLAGGDARHRAFVGGSGLPLRKEGHGH